MDTTFALTWDYRCPFARNAHEHVLTALQGGAPWDVRFLAFSLDQAHVEEGGRPVWEEPERYPALIANQAGIVVRDRAPEAFPAVHRALFAARHDRAIDLRERDAVARVVDEAGADGAGVLAEITAGWPLKVLEAEHTDAAGRLDVFGVPTFIVDDRAVFVRLMDRPGEDVARATTSIERVLELLRGWPDLNEYKMTKLGR